MSLGAAVAFAGALGFVLAVVATLRGSQEAGDGERVPVILARIAESSNNLILALVLLMLAALISAGGALRNRSLGS